MTRRGPHSVGEIGAVAERPAAVSIACLNTILLSGVSILKARIQGNDWSRTLSPEKREWQVVCPVP